MLRPDNITVLHQSILNINFEVNQNNKKELEIFEVLIDNAEDIYKKNGQGLTIFDMAALCKNAELDALLKKYDRNK